MNNHSVLQFDENPAFDLFSGFPHITMVGNQKCRIENFHSLFYISDTELVISSKCGVITIAGIHLWIPSFHDQYLEIEGIISAISFRK